MKIATWNVNSVRARLSRLVPWLQEHQPDVLCIQESKVEDHLFPTEPLEDEGYNIELRMPLPARARGHIVGRSGPPASNARRRERMMKERGLHDSAQDGCEEEGGGEAGQEALTGLRRGPCPTEPARGP